MKLRNSRTPGALELTAWQVVQIGGLPIVVGDLCENEQEAEAIAARAELENPAANFGIVRVALTINSDSIFAAAKRRIPKTVSTSQKRKASRQ